MAGSGGSGSPLPLPPPSSSLSIHWSIRRRSFPSGRSRSRGQPGRHRGWPCGSSCWLLVGAAGGAASSRGGGQARGLQARARGQRSSFQQGARPGMRPPGRGSSLGALRTTCSSSARADTRSSRTTAPPEWRLPPSARGLPHAAATKSLPIYPSGVKRDHRCTTVWTPLSLA
ncbi:hypothetical protein PVAP13_8KG275803 [Panicum virgatum]|uniref:Uncharacterized protein n=1 Tax=Panicum virgatum TaxID=38727 RepID=A0A8T0PJJ8_PANVG|nr:hypothetical protein PVAP13_8KG275803 [Panicum virgatum]